MKQLINALLVIGHISMAFIYIHTTMILYFYNEIIGDAFEFHTCKGVITRVHERTDDIVVEYGYVVNSIAYQDYKEVGKELFQQTGLVQGAPVVVNYNSSYQSFSYIESLYNEDRKSVRYIFFAPFLILLLIATFTDRDKWIRRYKQAFGLADKRNACKA